MFRELVLSLGRWLAWLGAVRFPSGALGHRIAVRLIVGTRCGSSCQLAASGARGCVVRRGSHGLVMGDASPLWGRDWSAGSRLVTTMILFGLGHLGYLAALRALRIQSKSRRSSSGTSGEGTNAVVLFAFLASVVIGIVSWNLIVVASDTLVARSSIGRRWSTR